MKGHKVKTSYKKEVLSKLAAVKVYLLHMAQRIKKCVVHVSNLHVKIFCSRGTFKMELKLSISRVLILN